MQFRRPLTREEQARMRSEYGLRLSDYVPEVAYLELLDEEVLGRLAHEPAFRAAVPYRAELKLAPRIGEREYRTVGRRGVARLWLEIVLFSDADPAAAARSLADFGAYDIRILDARGFGGPARIRAAAGEGTLLARIAERDDVRWVDEVGEVIEDSVSAAGTLQSGDASTHSVWAAGLHGEGQVIGVIDSTRIHIDHCFFRDSPANVPGPAHRKVLAIRDASGTTPTGHATFVAGCAAGDDLGSPGAHPHRGGAWAARLVSGNTKDLERSPLLAELVAAASSGATIHTNSWHNNSAGAGQPAAYDQSAADADTFMWLFEDHLVLGSAGNNGEEQGPPGTAKNAVCVGAAQADPDELTFGDGNGGPTADGRRKPDLMAPGCAIESAKANTRCRTTVKGCASSWATPHAAAAAALLRQYFTEGRHPTGTPRPEHAVVPSGALLKAMLLNSAIDMTGRPGHPGDREGWGLIRLDNVLGPPGRPRDVCVWDTRNAEGLGTGENRSHRLSVVAGAQTLKVTLVWTDAPGSPGSALATVNGLDLELVSPDGATAFYGDDRVNNVELALVTSPAPGDWTIRVVATAVNVGNPGQGYALVATTA